MHKWLLAIFALHLISCVAPSNDTGASLNAKTPVTQSGNSELKTEAEPDMGDESTIGDFQPERAALENYGQAPELANHVWLNND